MPGVYAAGDAAREKLLLRAVDCLRLTGELREELLPLAWARSGLAPDDYEDVLEMLCASGLLFQAEHRCGVQSHERL